MAFHPRLGVRRQAPERQLPGMTKAALHGREGRMANAGWKPTPRANHVRIADGLIGAMEKQAWGEANHGDIRSGARGLAWQLVLGAR